MKRDQNDITDELLMKYLLGEASEAEQAQAMQWIGSNDANKKYYDSLALIWDQSKDIAAVSNINADEAWLRFRQRTQRNAISIGSNKWHNWLKIAALLLLLAGSGAILFLTHQSSSIATKTANMSTLTIKTETSNKSTQIIKNEQVNNIDKIKESIDPKPVAMVQEDKVVKKAKINTYKKAVALNMARAKQPASTTKGIICNSTPCPIEICITQTIKCHDGHPSTISSCSTLEPDQSGRLHYTTHDKIGKHCTMSVDEITIKTISTGEMIVLNANSKPATARDFFKYITGQKKGGIVAGMFHDDCNNDHDCGLKFDNNFGDLILQ